MAKESKVSPELGSWGINKESWDLAVSPGDDFFRHANGAWLKSYELPDDKVTFGSIYELRDRAERQVHEIVIELAEQSSDIATINGKIGALYRTFMNAEHRNELGISPLRPVLERIRAIETHEDLIEAFGRAAFEGTNSPVAVRCSIDPKDPNQHVLMIGCAGLALADRDFYLLDDQRSVAMRRAYQKHINTMLGLLGHGEADCEAAACAILQLESTLAEKHWPRSALRDAERTYNPETRASFLERYNNLDWARFFRCAEVQETDNIVVTTPDALIGVSDVIRSTELGVWKKYLELNLVHHSAEFLSEDIEQAAFEFARQITGAQAQRERWKRGVEFVSAYVGEAVGSVYVDRHFPRADKDKALDLVSNLLAAYRDRISELGWMSDETRQKALEKLGSFVTKIGYPEKWKDYAALRVSDKSLYDNVLACRTFALRDELDKLMMPTDRSEWFMTPHTVNAYYNPVFNEVVFPAAILQPPYFDPSADDAVNYGAIGAVIGHEIGHGFDDQGSKYDARGVLGDWWDPQDRKRFEVQTVKLVDQFGGYSPVDGVLVDGEFTLGENIGDLGGLTIAYHAYRHGLNGNQEKVLDGLTGTQRFFLSWAQAWKSKTRDEMMVNLVRSDPHSPPEFRVNGIVRNVDAWYEAFDVDSSAALYLPESERVRVW